MKQIHQQAATNGTAVQSTPLDSEARKEVLAQRDRLIDLQSQSSQAMDKQILTLSGGALTLSITFIRQVVPAALPGTTPYLAIAWLILGLSLLAQLFSHFASQYGMMKDCERLDELYLGVASTTKRTKHWLGRAYQWICKKLSGLFEHRMTTHYLNIAAIIFCVAGIGLLAWFVWLNFPQLQIPLTK
jgi:hypothetical protein